MKRLIIALLFACAVPAFAAQPASSPPAALTAEQKADLDAYVAEAIEAWRVPGLSIAIVKGDEVLYLKGFGHRDGARKLPVTPDTLFYTASTTKAFTAFGVGLLVDRGKLDWDAPVQDYLPGFTMGDSIAGSMVTLRDMLSHRTGLPRHDFVWYNLEGVTRADLVGRIAHLQSSEPLRTTFQYNNLMYMTAGHVIERISDTTWEAFTRDNIFKPLGMTRSHFSIGRFNEDPDHATGHQEDDAHAPQPVPLRAASESLMQDMADPIGPAGSINSTARDYAQWMKPHLNRGVVDGRRVIGEAQLDAMHSPLIPVGGKPEFPEFTHRFYGMGWFADHYRGARRVQHGGNFAGFSSLVTLYPETGLGIAVFVNAHINPLPGWLSLDIADRLAGRPPLDWSRKRLVQRDLADAAQGAARERLDEMKVAGTRPAHPLAHYAGVYTHPGYGPFRVDLVDGALQAVFNRLPAKLVHWHYEVFNTETNRLEDEGFDNVRIAFQTDVRGRVSGLAVDLESSVAPILFAKQPDPRLSDPRYLRRFVGRYALMDDVVTIEITGNQLALNAPGQLPQTFVADVDGNFALEDAPSIGVRFVEQGGAVTGFELLQPDGVYEAKRIEGVP